MSGANDMSIAGLILEASIPVQLIMLLLLIISVMSWALIFQRSGVLNTASRKSKKFEDKFWSGIDLSKLSTELSQSDQKKQGLESLFLAGYKEFMRLRHTLVYSVRYGAL